MMIQTHAKYNRGLAAVAALAAALAISTSCPAGSTPSNDDCSNARVLAQGANPFTTVGATSAGPGVCVTIGRDVWFKFTPTFSGGLVISTCGDADFDTVIAAYNGCSCGSLTLLGCNDDATNCSGHTSKLAIAVTAGHCYFIRVAGFAGAQGTGVLTLSPYDPQNAANANRILSGAESDDRFGFTVSGNGRINSGPIEDVLVGGPRNDLGGNNIGRAYAFQGSDLSALYTKTGAAAGDQFGYSVATGCDVNDDGRDDLIIGAPFNDSGGDKSGHVYVYSGFDGSLLWEKSGAAAGDEFGFSVACAGDVNNDGFDDVLVGAPYSDSTGVDAGRVYVLNGHTGAVLKTRNGAAAGDLFGWAIAGVGDVNNDGKDDYAVGAPKNDTGGTDAGRVYLYSGANGATLQRFNGAAAGDNFGTSIAGMRFVSSLNYALLAIGAPNNDTTGSNAGQVKVYLRNISHPTPSGCSSLMCLRYTINGGNAGDAFGTSLAMGNLVGDSFADIIVGAPKADFNGSNSGAAYVFNGGTGALTKRYFGEAAGDTFGQSVANAGDVSNGGVNDLIVGAPLNDATGANAGRAYVFFLEPTNGLTDSPSGESQPGAGGGNGLLDPTVIIEGDAPISLFGDVNHDGVVNVADLAAILNAWGPCWAGESCPADLDGNGQVNVDDLMALIKMLTPGM